MEKMNYPPFKSYPQQSLIEWFKTTQYWNLKWFYPQTEMTYKQIIKELSLYVTEYHIKLLQMVFKYKEEQIILSTVTIIKEYNSTQENENYVYCLLEKLCRLYFNKKNKIK
jgi:hypothetical protein